MSILVLNEAEIRECVSMDNEAMAVVTKGFTKLTEGKVTVTPIMRIDIPKNHGEVDVKSALIHGLDSFAIKIASSFFDNRDLGLPAGSGLMVLLSAQTGVPLAILLDNGYLTDVRTGIAGAIAAKHLAPQKADTTGVNGAGMQARYQVRGIKMVRDFSRLMVYSLLKEEVDIYADEMAAELGVEVIKAASPEAVVRDSQVVVTTTPSHEPFLEAGWLHPGLHITCMGSDSEDKQELHAEVFGKVDRIVCNRKSQAFRLGELHHARDQGFLSGDDQVDELGELTSGSKPGRQSEDEITVCDLTGVGVQDTQIARLAYEKALGKGLAKYK